MGERDELHPMDLGLAEPRVIGPGFHDRVYAVVALVPAGALTTYGDVGTILGSPRVARQVGWALAALPATRTDVPWHRVINAQGAVSFKGDIVRATLQADLLARDGVTPQANGRYPLKDLRYEYPGVAVPFGSRDG